MARDNINYHLKNAKRVDYSDYSIGKTVKSRTLSGILSEIEGFDTKRRARLKDVQRFGNCIQYNYRFALLDFSILIFQ